MSEPPAGAQVPTDGAGKSIGTDAEKELSDAAVVARPLDLKSAGEPAVRIVSLRDVQEAASHADPRTTIRYARARGSLDRHATNIVAAYIAGAAR